MATTKPILDHIVLLVPHEILLNLPSWLSDAFTILEGGRHADGVTENKLILFQDGVYLELIAFVPGKEKERELHRWGRRPEGHIVDWANTLHSENDLAVIRSRVASAESGIKYSEPVSGGRLRPDGIELKWTISAPYIDDETGVVHEFTGGEAPFWCLDRTPRDLRVPHRVESNVQHPSGAAGVAGVTVSVRDVQLFERLKHTYDALQGQKGEKLEPQDGRAANGYVWSLVIPDIVGGNKDQPRLVLALAEEASPSKDALKGPPAAYVSIELVASSDRSISGHLGDGNWLIDFKLKA